MTLQSSGAISLNDVQGEHGGSNPISLSEYYGIAQSVPGSGTISLSNFYSTYWEGTLTIGTQTVGKSGTDYGYQNGTYSNSTSAFGSFSQAISGIVITPMSTSKRIAKVAHNSVIVNNQTSIYLQINGQTSNAGFTTIVINGTSLNRTAAASNQSYTAASGTGWQWRWAVSSNIIGTSGTIKVGIKVWG